MALIARILSVSLVAAALGAGLAFLLFQQYSDWTGIALFLGSVSAIIGAVAGAAREIVAGRSLPRRG